MFLKITITIWLLLYNKCFCVSEEYYNDDFVEIINNLTFYNDSNARRTIKGRSLSDLQRQYNFNNETQNVISNSEIQPSGRLFRVLDQDYENFYNATFLNLINIQYTKKKPETVFSSKSLRDYDYAPDTEIYKFSQASRYDRKQGIKNTSETKRQNQSDISKLQHVRFYNLEPAVTHITNIEKSKVLLRDNVWYVPQEFPCWELPVIYGEMRNKKKKSEIFLIYGGKLDNVIDNWTEAQNLYKVGDPPISHIFNKWCRLQPCYADHTLCLFPSPEVSNICDKGYKVLVPTVLDQITIIRTINSMRNRVAHGLVNKYSHLPTAANMKQINYDYDLEKIAEAWLRQCLPGAAPCSALDGLMVSQLECTKYMKYCCLKKLKTRSLWFVTQK